MLSTLLTLGLILAQVVPQPSADNPTSILAAVIWLGGIIVLGLLVALRTLWKSNQDKDVEIKALYVANASLSEKLLRDTLAVTVDAASRLDESSKTLESAMGIIHQASAHQLSADAMVKIEMLLNELAGRRSRKST